MYGDPEMFLLETLLHMKIAYIQDQNPSWGSFDQLILAHGKHRIIAGDIIMTSLMRSF